MRRLLLPMLLCGLFAGVSTTHARPKAKTVRALTFNIRYDFKNDGQNRWHNRVDLVVKRIKESQAHIVCLQEDKSHQVDDLKPKLPEFAFVGRGRNATGSGERCSILYNTTKFKKKANGDFWLSDTPDVPGSNTWRDKYPRKVTWVYLENKKGKGSILVLNTHLPEGRRDDLRRKGVEVIAKWLEARVGGPSSAKKRKRSRRKSRSKKSKMAVLIAGDFNTGAGTEPHDLLTKSASLRLKDAWEVARPSDRSPGTYGGFNGLRTRNRIDWLLVGGRVRVLRAGKFDQQVDGRWPSDHYAVFTDIELR